MGKRNRSTGVVLLLAGVLLAGCTAQEPQEAGPEENGMASGDGLPPEEGDNATTADATAALQIESPMFANDTRIPTEFTCDGRNVSPPLNVTGVPAEAESLALITFDPDAGEQGFTHWVVWNLPPNTPEIPRDADIEALGGLEGVRGNDEMGYGGPCPPSGTHRYRFTVYALDTELDLDEGATREALLAAMEGHVVAQDTLVGLYGRE